MLLGSFGQDGAPFPSGPGVVVAMNAGIGGAWERCITLCNYLADSGWKVRLVTPRVVKNRIRHRPRGAIAHQELAFSFPGTLRFALACLATVAGAWRESSTDLQAVSYVGTSGLALGLVRRMMFGYVISHLGVVARGDEGEKHRAAAGGRSVFAIVRYGAHLLSMWALLAMADRVVVQSESGLRRLVSTYGRWIVRKSQVVPNAVETLGRKDPAPECCRAKPEPGPGRSRLDVLFVGRLKMHVKGLDRVLEAAEMCDNGVKIQIAGDGPDRSLLTDAIVARNLGDRVALLGWIQDPHRLMRSCDLLVVPSRIDPCPNVALEALSVGCPVVGGDAPGVIELLDRQMLAVAEPVGRNLATVMNKAATDSAYLARLRQACSERARELRFHWARVISEALLNGNWRGCEESMAKQRTFVSARQAGNDGAALRSSWAE